MQLAAIGDSQGMALSTFNTVNVPAADVRHKRRTFKLKAAPFAASPKLCIFRRAPSTESKHREVCLAKLIPAASDNEVHSGYDTFKFQYRERTCAGSGAKSNVFHPEAISAHSVCGYRPMHALPNVDTCGCLYEI